MKILSNTSCIILLITLLLTACKDDDAAQSNFPTAEEFQSLRQTALDNITQNFQLDFSNENAFVTSEQGVELYISTCTDASGTQTTGIVDLEYVEIFDRGTMLVTNKPTMGISSSGEEGILISGGEFYIKAKQDESEPQFCAMYIEIPVSLTGEYDDNMSLWEGNIDADDNLIWSQSTSNSILLSPDPNPFRYSAIIFGDLDWFNCDVFYDDPRPKTDITVETPTGYSGSNSAVYFSIAGEPSGLGTIGGQLPVGLEAHFIFVTEEDNNWRYAVESVTISENEAITFTLDDTVIATESELIYLVNTLP